MYEEYFGLSKKPFSIVPDPHCYYLSAGHAEALAHLVYGIKSEDGFVLLTGDIGTGKTTACRRLLMGSSAPRRSCLWVSWRIPATRCSMMGKKAFRYVVYLGGLEKTQAAAAAGGIAPFPDFIRNTGGRS
jgi:type II secretory pathway predicted ATPase ExeA